jgi:hypothetical protein
VTKFLVSIHQRFRGTMVVEADSPEDAVAKANARNARFSGWDDITDNAGEFRLTDEDVTAIPYVGTDELTAVPDVRR